MDSMPRTVEDVFKDYRNRRSGICKALTADVEEFHRQCDPEKENLCLYGHPNESWEVSLPVEEVPPELPEPALGINFAREGMPRREWLSLVAVHSDAWLLAVASFYAACFDRNERKRLFNLINELPTVLEVVTGRKSTKEKTSSVNNGSGNKTKPTAKMPPPQQRASEVPVKPPPQLFPSSKDEEEEDEEEGEEEDEGPEGEGGEEEDEHGETYCGTCSGPYEANEFWICCDLCERWYHGKCVKITPARAEHIKQYKCPLCQNNKRPRPGM